MKPRRTARALSALSAVFVSLVAAGTLTSCGAASSAPAAAPSYPAGTSVGGAVPAHIMNLAFTDQDGRTVHLSDFAGKVVVLQDVMTLCQELCPIDTSTLVRTASDYAKTAADPSDVVFLSITVDPQRDTPAQLAAYRKLYVGAPGRLPQWRLLTGSAEDVAALWKYLGVWVHRVPQDAKVRNWRTGQPLTYDIEHSDQVFFLDGQGNERYLLDGMPSLGTGNVPTAMQRFMSADGHRNEMKTGGWTADQALGVISWLSGTARS